jgi:hypothetical protein
MTALSATFSIAAALKNEKGRTFLPGLQPFQRKIPAIRSGSWLPLASADTSGDIPRRDKTCWPE